MVGARLQTRRRRQAGYHKLDESDDSLGTTKRKQRTFPLHQKNPLAFVDRLILLFDFGDFLFNKVHWFLQYIFHSFDCSDILMEEENEPPATLGGRGGGGGVGGGAAGGGRRERRNNRQAAHLDGREREVTGRLNLGYTLKYF